MIIIIKKKNAYNFFVSNYMCIVSMPAYCVYGVYLVGYLILISNSSLHVSTTLFDDSVLDECVRALVSVCVE